MSYEAWRREVEMGRMSDWNEDKNGYDPPPQQPPVARPSGKFPVVIPEKLKEDK
jgi:hypothetical protein